MSHESNCWDNAAMEGFFSRFKAEALYAAEVNAKQEGYSWAFEYIEMFYNRLRKQSALGYKSLNIVEREYT